MRYRQALEHLHSLIDFEKLGAAYFGRDRFQLAAVRRLLHEVGDPQDGLSIVHIAGTKGKGSTAAMLDSILRQAGRRVALFTQPHLVDIRERTRLDGELIDRRTFAAAFARVWPAISALNAEAAGGAITFYEAHLALALVWFASRGADVAIMETGLGGRLDATNALQPIACAITRIDYDHTDLLGDRLEDIAREKAGILKAGVPCVLGAQAPEVMTVLRSHAEAVGAPVTACPSVVDTGRGRFLIRGDREYRGLRLPLRGTHQRENAAVAVGLVEALSRSGFRAGVQAVRAGLRSVRLPGRFQVVPGAPTYVLDVAHNAVSARALRQALQELLRELPGKPRLLLVVGIAADKDIPAFAKALFPIAARVLCTQARSPRAATPKRIQEAGASLAPVVLCAATVRAALREARREARDDDVVCITGSFHVVGEAMEALGVRP